MTFHGINDKLYFDDNKNIGIGITNPSTNFHIATTDGIVIPVGTSAQRVDVTGSIRYNTDNSTFEGFKGTWGSLGGVIDVDQDTYVSAETSAGADNDDLKFFTAGTERMKIDSNGNTTINSDLIVDTNLLFVDASSNLVNVNGDLDIWGKARFESAASYIESGVLSLSNSLTGPVIDSTGTDIRLSSTGNVGALTINSSGDTSLTGNLELNNNNINSVKKIYCDSDDVTNKINFTRSDSSVSGFTITQSNAQVITFNQTENANMNFQTNNATRFRLEAAGDINCMTNTIKNTNILEVNNQGSFGDISPYIYDEGGSNEIPFELTVRNYIKVDAVTSDAGSIYFGNGVTNGIYVSSAYWNVNFDRPIYSFNGTEGCCVRTRYAQLGLKMGNQTPSIDFAISDVDTGLNSEGTDELGIYTGGIERIRFDSSGNVGIGTNSPSHKLHVDGNILVNSTVNLLNTNFGLDIGSSRTQLFCTTSGKLQVGMNDMIFTTSSTEMMRLTSTGLGIGTDSPQAPLHLEKASDSAGVIELLRLAWNDSNLRDTQIGDGTKISFHTSSVNNAVGTEEGAYISALRTSGAEASLHTKLTFATNDGTNMNERMILQSSSNINMYSLNTIIDSQSTSNCNLYMQTTNGTGRVITRTDTGNVYLGDVDTGNSSGDVHIRAKGANTVTITNDSEDTSGAHLGIGNTNPGITLAIGDTDTGFDWMGDGEIAWYSNNTRKAYLTTQGNFCIGNRDIRDEVANTGLSEALIFTDNNSYADDRYFLTCWQDANNTHQMGMKFDYYTGSGGTANTHSRLDFISNAQNDQAINDGGMYTSHKFFSSGFTQFYAYNSVTLELYRDTTNAGNDIFKVYSNWNGTNNGVAIIEANGDFLSDTGSYGQTSDIRLKENIVDASSQWEDIKAIKFRKYNFIANPEIQHIGVIAQELEETSPGLVNTSIEDEMGTKSVKSSIMYMKGMKALQEAMSRIEELEEEKTNIKEKYENLLERIIALENN